MDVHDLDFEQILVIAENIKVHPFLGRVEFQGTETDELDCLLEGVDLEVNFREDDFLKFLFLLRVDFLAFLKPLDDKVLTVL